MLIISFTARNNFGSVRQKDAPQSATNHSANVINSLICLCFRELQVRCGRSFQISFWPTSIFRAESCNLSFITFASETFLVLLGLIPKLFVRQNFSRSSFSGWDRFLTMKFFCKLRFCSWARKKNESQHFKLVLVLINNRITIICRDKRLFITHAIINCRFCADNQHYSTQQF